MEAAEALSEPPIRPRLELALPLDQLDMEDWRTRMRNALDKADAPVEGYLSRRHCDVMIVERDRHFWSPALSLECEERDGQLRIHCRFGPHPRVWTLFVAIHTVLIFGAIAGSVVSATQWTLDMPPTALWGLPLSLGFTALVHGINVWGRGQGADQMRVLHDWIFDAMQVPTSTVLEDDIVR